MGFYFKRKESVPKGVKRLALERIDAALDALKDCRRAKAVHGVRKDIKKVRAILRLARERIPTKAYRRQTKLLRKAADRLAPARDAFVKGAALRNLTERAHRQLAPGVVRALRKQLDGDLAQAERKVVRKKSVRKVKRLLESIPEELSHLKFDRKGWEVIAPGVETAFSRGRATYLRARKQPTPEALHEWRKRVKDLWYQVCMLRPIDPQRMGPLAAELKTLSELLGDDHDLYLLEQSSRLGDDAQPELFDANTLREMIVQRRGQLQAKSFEMGARIYVQKPSEFRDRLSRSWQAWRNREGTRQAERKT